jgi:hypothetical protein
VFQSPTWRTRDECPQDNSWPCYSSAVSAEGFNCMSLSTARRKIHYRRNFNFGQEFSQHNKPTATCQLLLAKLVVIHLVMNLPAFFSSYQSLWFHDSSSHHLTKYDFVISVDDTDSPSAHTFDQRNVKRRRTSYTPHSWNKLYLLKPNGTYMYQLL